MYFIHSIDILVDNDVNKVHQKFPLDIYLICLNFLPSVRCYYIRICFHYFFRESSVIVVPMSSTYASVSTALFSFLYQRHILQRVEWTCIKAFFSTLQLHVSLYKQHFYNERQAEIGKKLSKSSATPWDWTFDKHVQ